MTVIILSNRIPAVEMWPSHTNTLNAYFTVKNEPLFSMEWLIVTLFHCCLRHLSCGKGLISHQHTETAKCSIMRVQHAAVCTSVEEFSKAKNTLYIVLLRNIKHYPTIISVLKLAEVKWLVWTLTVQNIRHVWYRCGHLGRRQKLRRPVKLLALSQ